VREDFRYGRRSESRYHVLRGRASVARGKGGGALSRVTE
jgi:hypothetical protein